MTRITLQKRRIYLIGPLPPPVHGASVIIAGLRDKLKEIGIPLIDINVAAPQLDRSWAKRLKRSVKIVRGFLRFMLSRPKSGDVLFISVSGGFGKVYEILFTALARLFGLRIYLRHCSYAYLDRVSLLAQWLISVAGHGATHVVLSAEMVTRLRGAYPICPQAIILSNAMFVESLVPTIVSNRESVKTIGFLSNISEEKGVFDFLQVAHSLESEGLELSAKLAGPFDDAGTEKRVRQFLQTVRSVEYVGPKYGDKKSAFFKGIDVLLFPTRYANEASPVTIHEAMSYGIPVIACNRGSISELVTTGCGLVVSKDEDFVKAAVEQLEAWKMFPGTFQQASRETRAQFDRMCRISHRQWAALRAELLAGGRECAD